jgi:hypothetical protein
MSKYHSHHPLSIMHFFSCIAILASAATIASAQDDMPNSFSREPISIRGNLSSYSELYHINGAPARRPDASQRFIGTFDVDLYGLQTGVQLMYSTEDNRLQQSLNQLALTGAYHWVRFSAGSVYPSYTNLVLNGNRVTGAAIALTPGKFAFEFAGGENRRAVEGDTVTGRLGTYKRMLFAGRIGMGSPGGDNFRISALYARDDSNSISVPNTILPEENLVVGVSGGMSFMQSKLLVNTEINISAFNRNLEARRVEVSDIPEFISRLFTKTLSASLGYAGAIEVLYNDRVIAFSGGYSYVSSAYHSLGVASLINDYQELRLQPQVRLLRSRLRLSCGLTYSKNNIINVLEATATRTNITPSISYVASDNITLSLTGMYFVNSLEPMHDSSSAIARKTILTSATFSPFFFYEAFGSRHSTSISACIQSIENTGAAQSPTAGGAYITSNFNLYLNHSTTLPGNIVVGINGGVTRATDLNSTFGSVSGIMPILSNLVSLSAVATINDNKTSSAHTSVIGGTLTVTWMPWKMHSFSLSGRASHVSWASSSYMESFLTLNYNFSM